MQKAKGSTWILVAVLVLLGLAAIAEHLRDRLSAVTPLTRVDARAHVLQVQCPEKPLRRFERIQGAWLMTAPWRVPADAGAVEQLLDIARAPARFRYEKGRFDATAFGLDYPVGTLEIDSTRIAIGAVDEVNGLRYVGVGDRAAAVRDRLTEALQEAPEHFVDRRPLAGIYATKFVRDAGGAWTDADRDLLMRLRANDVHVLKASPKGVEIDVLDGHEQPWRYVFDADAGVLARLTPPLGYALSAEDVVRLRASLRVPPPAPSS
jgi:hypothetical protein